MGFIDKIRSGRLFFGKREPSLVVRFELLSEHYMLEEFDLEFGQNVKGKITITMSDVPGEGIHSWMMDPFRKIDGEFRFLVNDGRVNQGAVLQINFRDAYCTHYRKLLNPQGAGTLTTLVIRPGYIRIGNEEQIS